VLSMLVKSLLIWLGILVLAIVNGALREAFLVPSLGQIPGFIISGVFLSLLILFVTYVSLPWLGVRRVNHFVAIGLGWLILTVIFEFSFGLLQGKTLAALIEAYTFKGGNIWPLVLLVTACAPYMAAKLRGWA